MFNNPAWAAKIDAPMASAITSALSEPRLGSFGLCSLVGRDEIGAVGRHGRNIILCEAAYPALHMLEVVMRNRIHDEFTSHYGSANWYAQTWLLPDHASMVANAHSDLQRLGKTITPDRVVAALSFGFWCGMFSAKYECTSQGHWPRLLQPVLPRVPKSWRTRSKVQGRVEEVRKLRNRVFHHEPISNTPDLFHLHRGMVELLGWFSPEARAHLESMCRFRAAFADHLI